MSLLCITISSGQFFMLTHDPRSASLAKYVVCIWIVHRVIVSTIFKERSFPPFARVNFASVASVGVHEICSIRLCNKLVKQSFQGTSSLRALYLIAGLRNAPGWIRTLIPRGKTTIFIIDFSKKRSENSTQQS